MKEKKCLLHKYADHILADEEIKRAFELLKAEKEGRLLETPCKVGDKVYKIMTSFGYVRECKVVGFHLGKFPTLRGIKRKEYFVCYADHYLYHIPFDDIGKTVFLSHEDAEKALEDLHQPQTKPTPTESTTESTTEKGGEG